MAQPAATAEVVQQVLSPQQALFFHTFGFVHLPGLFADDVERIERGFDEAYGSESNPTPLDPANPYHTSPYPEYAERVRDMVPFFIERSEDLAWIRTDPRVTGIAEDLLGRRYEYAESDGNHFNCDVYWHIDAFGAPIDQFHIKMYFYLDRLTAENGALRVIPGSNHYREAYAQRLYGTLMADPSSCVDTYGVELEDIPSWTIPVEPGDLIVGNYRTLHGSFHGAPGRRLFTVNWKQPAAG
jgi:hypothetical protein